MTKVHNPSKLPNRIMDKRTIVNNTTKMSTKKRRHILQLMTWNVHDIRLRDEGIKTNIPDFQNIINATDIVCLQETKEPVKISNYRCFNSNRHSSRSGGVCIAIKNDISKGVIAINTKCCNDIVAVKLKKSYFGLLRDIVIINIYDSPINSSFKKSQDDDKTTLEHASEVISKLPKDTGIIILGDFNARIGLLHDQDEKHYDPSSDYQTSVNTPELIKRSSMDTKINTNGRPFLDFVKNNELGILNGRILGDVFGEYTCIKYNGCSVVDYLCASYRVICNIKSLKVGDLSYLSDHRPVSATFEADCQRGFTNYDTISKFENAPRRFKWKSDSKDDVLRFQKAQAETDIRQSIDELINSKLETPDDVHQLNDKLNSLYNKISTKSLSQSKPSIRTNRKKWYDWECRKAKRELNKASRAVSKNPSNSSMNKLYHQKKKEFKSLTKFKKSAFLLETNLKIETGRNLNWKIFKDLKDYHKDTDPFDTYDLQNFFHFFKELYRKKCQKTNHAPDEDDNPDTTNPSDDDLLILNNAFTLEEIDKAIHNLKLKKSVSLDLISNEMLKYSITPLRKVLLHLFNGCLNHGIYPWHTSITSPLHKKGDKEDPDNYRAITLGSCAGKLFSSILLDRLTRYRNSACPDIANQLGFCKGSQTSDHILVLKTIIDKYLKKQKKRVYACFVDYKKAFDRVCREALIYKLSNLGIGGNFFRCINDMYSQSSTRIKLIQKLSDVINVEVGTEQGHPLSPELFKIFIHDLSEQLNRQTKTNVPTLNNVKVSHLLWADDLVLLALDPQSLQHLLNILNNYVNQWELEVNTDKTNVMVFNSSGRLLQESYGFTLGDHKLLPTRHYCYLGISFSINGSFKTAIKNLNSKGKRAYYQIKRTIDVRALSTKSLFTLFDALVLPIITYAVQVWLPYTNAGKHLCDGLKNQHPKSSFLQKAPKDPFELFHLQYIKWVLGLHKRASNICCYGDTGRYPISIKVLPQSIKYFIRVEQLATNEPSSLVGNAFYEQKHLNLEWFETWNNISLDSLTPDQCRDKIADTFVLEWDTKRYQQSKLQFYNSIKASFGAETYLEITNKDSRAHLSRLRASAHDLRVETGRYAIKGKAPTLSDRICRYCCHTSDRSNITNLEALPLFNPIIENEVHVLIECPAYNHLRILLSDDLKCNLLLHHFSYIMDNPALNKELGLYLNKAFVIRNPAKKSYVK